MAQATGVRSPRGTAAPHGTAATARTAAPNRTAATARTAASATARTAAAAAGTGTSKPARRVPLSSAIASKSLSFSEAIVWMACVNAGWIAFTLLGGVLFGFAPATATAYALCRRRLRGDEVAFLRDFWRAYRAEFWRANAVLLPVAVVCVLVASTLRFAIETGPGIVVLAVGVVAVVCAGVVAVLPGMYVHYELRTARYASTASRFVLANPGPALLLLLTAGGIALLTTMLPALLVFFSIGAWIQASTALCLSFFASNDERMAALAGRSPGNRV